MTSVKKKKKKEKKKKVADAIMADDSWADDVGDDTAPLDRLVLATQPRGSTRMLVPTKSDEAAFPVTKRATTYSVSTSAVATTGSSSFAKVSSAFKPSLRVQAEVRVLCNPRGISAGTLCTVVTEEWTGYRGWEVKPVVQSALSRSEFTTAFNAATAVKFKAKELEVLS